jgi:hypothetical protein
VWYYEASEDRKIVGLTHVDTKGDIEFRMPRTVHETLRREYVILLADNDPERGRVQGNVPPFPTNLGGGDDEGTPSEEAEDVDEKLGRNTIDGPPIASKSVEFCQGIFE